MIRRIVTAITILAGATLSAQTQTQTQAPANAPAPSLFPVTRVVLYKSGVGYFEHLPTVTGKKEVAGLQTVQMRIAQELAALIEGLSLDEQFRD